MRIYSKSLLVISVVTVFVALWSIGFARTSKPRAKETSTSVLQLDPAQTRTFNIPQYKSLFTKSFCQDLEIVRTCTNLDASRCRGYVSKYFDSCDPDGQHRSSRKMTVKSFLDWGRKIGSCVAQRLGSQENLSINVEKKICKDVSYW